MDSRFCHSLFPVTAAAGNITALATSQQCIALWCAGMQLRAQVLSLRSAESMVGITSPKKPHFRLLQSNPELKVMLVQCHEVMHTLLDMQQPYMDCFMVRLLDGAQQKHAALCFLVEQDTFYSKCGQHMGNWLTNMASFLHRLYCVG